MIKKIFFPFLILTAISCSTNNTKKDPVQQLYDDAKKGNAEAQFKLGFKYYFGDQVPLNRDSSKYWLNESAMKGHAIAKKTYQGLFEIIPSIEKNDSIK